MSTKELAIKDIKDDLAKHGKCFIAFRKELNPTMDLLVKRQIEQQQSLFPANPLLKAKSQLVATCLFSKGNVIYNNYEKYYGER